MFSTMDHSACPKEKCRWERYHADLSARESVEKYMDTPIDNVNIGTSRQTRLTAQSDQLSIADGVKLAKERLYTLAWRLHHDLSTEVFEKETEIMIENCRVVSDLKTLILQIHEGSILVGSDNKSDN